MRRFPHEGRVLSASLWWRPRVAVTDLGGLCVGREARRFGVPFKFRSSRKEYRKAYWRGKRSERHGYQFDSLPSPNPRQKKKKSLTERKM
ncbi:hypothetical protein E2C01_032130 [Portunus trituberculatus]|uniref:Uncharacterized protein n=1 Tax=Portunus trituberculatus TaxID=210409 RepID=A0A5B7F051_PORTR|nr:hypothetical protein [Portunus trituberculatus]